jgi:hypothetical protein
MAKDIVAAVGVVEKEAVCSRKRITWRGFKAGNFDI